ncbi:MAG: cation-translocating P-type ATPase [Firmicutes bacterium]|nr:cation-translocating P-type ATPase [Bacillota bacterium]
MFSRWTALDGDEVLRHFETLPGAGLSEEEAEKRRRRWGKNILAAPSRLSLPLLFLNQFRDFMVLVLLGATLLAALLGEISDALTILIIVLLNAVLGLIQEYRAERSLEALKKLAAPKARVRRDGAVKEVAAEGVVPGDLVYLQAGDRICADLRLLETQGLTVNEAPLTGESAAILKSSAPLTAPAASPGDADNMAFSGTEVLAGRGRGLAVATGMETEIGRIAHLIKEAERSVTPLQARLGRLGQVLVWACLGVCAAMTVFGMIRGEPPYAMLMAGISLAVAAIPEGLPAIVTISLALGVQRMIRRRAIVRRLPAVETLGSATVICSDKTGTLTENKMSVNRIFAGDSLYQFSEGRFQQKKGATGAAPRSSPPREGALHLSLFIAAQCNNAYRDGSTFRGDPTEAALLQAAAAAGFAPGAKPREQEYPFSSERKMMSVILQGRGRHRRQLLLKGAPEIVLERCLYYHSEKKGPIALTAAKRRELLAQLEIMAGLALRPLAVAYRELPERSSGRGDADREEAEAVEKELIWAGLFGLEDPPRPEALPAIRLCRRAGIKVVMITGDHRSTAEAIARRLEILRPGGKVLTGAELNSLDDRRLQKEIGRVQVFARVSPFHKLRIVRALKRRGEVVAMTGDGINDAPAVKESDIGIAMGRTGTDVTREAASLVLADDNFSTIVAAVEEGRTIYSNIRKFIRFMLGCNTGEVLTMILAVLCGLPLPLRPIQILWINLVTDGLPALALSADPPAEELMEQPPRRRGEGLFSRGLWGKLLLRGGLIGAVTIALFSLALAAGEPVIKARTIAFAALITCQLIYVYDCRSEEGAPQSRRRNLFLDGAVLSSVLLMMVVIYHPFLSIFFGTAVLTAGEWAVICAASLLPTLVDGVLALPGRLKRLSRQKRADDPTGAP